MNEEEVNFGTNYPTWK